MDELKSIDEINKKYGTAFPFDLEQDEFIKTVILNIFNENIIPETTCGSLLTIISEYYGAIKNERLRIKYLLKSVESKNPFSYACCYLGKYYYKLKNYEETEKYFLMGVKLKSSDCLDLLKNYYMKNTYLMLSFFLYLKYLN
jgi:tetratricopeptide (TPR) repeat protein